MKYFISKRALYIVCWKLTEEEKGINEIQNWLSNIQTRAPGSPVLIVGTHQDQLAKLRNYKELSSYLQRLIYERFVRPTGENETISPYPPVMASLEISSKTGFNIKVLAKLIYEVAAQMKAPGFKDQLLLEQKIPLSYMALEECISYIVKKLRTKGQNPVLNTSSYLKEIRLAIEHIYPQQSSGGNGGSHMLQVRFRDDAEVLQATQFLHDNGTLLHYNDVALADYFFLDPQWLCDVLATIITIREINPFAAKGLMKIKDLLILFKGSRFNETEEIMKFIVDLLGKFELALTWDNENLLIPSLLPSEAMLPFAANQAIRVDMLLKQNAYTHLFNSLKFKNPLLVSDLYKRLTEQQLKYPVEALIECKTIEKNEQNKEDNARYNNSITRLYCLSYLPSGFFSRLITRILCDNILKNCLIELIDLDCSCMNENQEFMSEEARVDQVNLVMTLIEHVCEKAEWRCWQTGIELRYLGHTLVSVKELLFDPLQSVTNKRFNLENNIYSVNPVLYRDCENELKLKASNKQCTFFECYASFKDLLVSKNGSNTTSGISTNEQFMLRILCNRKVSTKLFAIIIEIIDSLLEDWYPDLGGKNVFFSTYLDF